MVIRQEYRKYGSYSHVQGIMNAGPRISINISTIILRGQPIWPHQWPTASQKTHTYRSWMRDTTRILTFFCGNQTVEYQPQEPLAPLLPHPCSIPISSIADRFIWQLAIFFWFLCFIYVSFLTCFWMWFWWKMVMVKWLPYHLYDKAYLSCLLFFLSLY